MEIHQFICLTSTNEIIIFCRMITTKCVDSRMERQLRKERATKIESNKTVQLYVKEKTHKGDGIEFF